MAETETARQATAEANRLRQRAEDEKTALRKQLLDQFNLILETRDSARGLIVNMADVLFDIGKYTPSPGNTREAGQGLRHRPRAPRPAARCGRPHRFDRQR